LIPCSLNRVKVAAKIVPGDADQWVQDEIENEVRKLESLRPLQGLVVPEKVFAGKVNSGRDRLSITKFVEGQHLDEAPRTQLVAANARRALKEIHNRGYIHGDVMPRNILVRKTGECVLLDLGQATNAKTEDEKEMEVGELEVWL
jgi:RIO-like serine/threonine protein kinase